MGFFQETNLATNATRICTLLKICKSCQASENTVPQSFEVDFPYFLILARINQLLYKKESQELIKTWNFNATSFETEIMIFFFWILYIQ